MGTPPGMSLLLSSLRPTRLAKIFRPTWFLVQMESEGGMWFRRMVGLCEGGEDLFVAGYIPVRGSWKGSPLETTRFFVVGMEISPNKLGGVPQEVENSGKIAE